MWAAYGQDLEPNLQFSGNSYDRLWSFRGWDQSDQNLPYTWTTMWTGPLSRCSTSNSNCNGDFG